MILYLDQNKWIELAKIVHGIDQSVRGRTIVRELRAAIDTGCVIPLSGMHYMETARIKNAGRRARLGTVMWDFSRGQTFASYPTVVEHEVEVALAKHFSHIHPSNLQLIGKGIRHAFGQVAMVDAITVIDEEIERAMLTGNSRFGVDPLSFDGQAQRESFFSHLDTLHKTKHEIPKSKWENWLYGVAIVDIRNPLTRIMIRHNISKDAFEGFTERQYKEFVEAMPTRRLDVHLHRQVLRNPSYKPKKTDLEDWAGVAVAASYCDVVVCERHMADLIQRDRFAVRARIETNLADAIKSI